MIDEMVRFCAPPDWAVAFFDQVDSWREARLRRTHEHETDAAAYCAHLGLHVRISFCHVDIDPNRRTLASLFSWANPVEREFFFRATQTSIRA